jgi:hypothetical protein
MTRFPSAIWLLAISRTLRWLIAYEPPAVRAKLTFGTPRRMAQPTGEG